MTIDIALIISYVGIKKKSQCSNSSNAILLRWTPY